MPLVIIVIGGALILVALAAIAVAASSRSGGSPREHRPRPDDSSGLSRGFTSQFGSSMSPGGKTKPPDDAKIDVDTNATTLGPADAASDSSGRAST